MSPARRTGRGHAAPRRLVYGTSPSGPGLTAEQHLLFVARQMPEKVLQEHVRVECKNLDLRHYHTFNSARSAKGWPDSAIAGPHGFKVRELKRQDEDPTPAQQAWLDDLERAGVDVGVWRPLDWLNGTISRELAVLRYGDRVPGAGGVR